MPEPIGGGEVHTRVPVHRPVSTESFRPLPTTPGRRLCRKEVYGFVDLLYKDGDLIKVRQVPWYC